MTRSIGQHRTRTSSRVWCVGLAACIGLASCCVSPHRLPANDPLDTKLGALGAVLIAEGHSLSDVPEPVKLWQLGDLYLYALPHGQVVSAWHDEQTRQIVTTSWADEEGFFDRLAFGPLPQPPTGWTVREVARLPHQGVRLLPLPNSKQEVLVLGRRGDVWSLDLRTGELTTRLERQSYVGPFADVLGLAMGPDDRLYIATNQKDDSVVPWINRVVIFRTNPLADDHPLKPRPWLTTSYPYGVNQFNHGVAHLAFGPDGMLYACSGSRTDADEDGDLPHIAPGGETPITACIWRLDPAADEQPQIEIFARGLRNAFGFDWDERGRMFATESGPNRKAPEELNLIESGRHYGFPYRFGTLNINPYEHLRDRVVPAGLTFTDPIPNLGPDGGGSPDQPLHTFTDHSSPVGVTFVGDAMPPPLGGGFLVVRYGNQVELTQRAGFDLLSIRIIDQPDGGVSAQTHRLLADLARPIDVAVVDGSIYILEFGRGSDNRDWVQQVLPGRVIELRPKH